MSHTVVATFKIKPEHTSEFQQLLDDPDHGLSVTKGWEGCVSLERYVDLDDPNTIVLWEKWKLRQNHQSYLEMRTTTGFFDKVGPMFAVEPAILHLGTAV